MGVIRTIVSNKTANLKLTLYIYMTFWILIERWGTGLEAVKTTT